MASKTINALTAAAALADADIMRVDQGVSFNSRKATLTQWWTWIQSKLFGLPSLSFRNRIINGDFSVAQRGTSFTSATNPANNDDTYHLDRWYGLSDGNNIVDVSQNTAAAPTGKLTCIALDVKTVNKKFGIAQIVEQKNLVDLVGNNVTLSFWAKVSATTNLDNIKAALIAWNGAADVVTSDVVSAWGVEGTNPTLVANCTYENTPANLGVTTSWVKYTISAAFDTASAKNLILFIWSDVTDTTLGDFLYITDVQVEAGSNATPFERRDYGSELNLACRYFQLLPKWFGSWLTGSATFVTISGPFPTIMRAAPTATLIVGTNAVAEPGVVNKNITSIAGNGLAADGGYLDLAVAAHIAGVPAIYNSNGTIHVSSEL